MPAQLPLFAKPRAVTFVSPPPPALSRTAWPLANWQAVCEVGLEVGLPLIYVEKDLLHNLSDPDGARLWEVLWTTHHHLEVWRENSVRFTLTLGDKDYRFVAVHLLPADVLVRLDSVQPETKPGI